MNVTEAQEHLMTAEEDVAAVMIHIEVRDPERARDVVNEIAASGDGVTRMAWMVLRLADLLRKQEAANERLHNKDLS